MKKMVLGLVIILFFHGQVFAQSRPIMGYDQVPWGASVDDVRRAYNLGENIVLKESRGDDPNVASLTQDNVSDSIESREFLFNKWKGTYQLYRVWVIYKDTSDGTKNNLVSVLENRFGRQTNYDFQRGTTSLMFQQLNYTEETITFGRYSPDLVVDLVYRIIYAGYEKDSNNLLGQNRLWVGYTWKKFRDEYQASRLGL